MVGDCLIEVLLAVDGCWLSVPCCFEIISKSFFHGKHATTFSVIVNALDFSFI